MKNLIKFPLLLLFSSSLFAANGPSSLNISPIVGMERVHKLYPTPHTRERTIFGARFIWGPRSLSLELEGTRADDTENFPNRNLKVHDESYAVKLGLRSRFAFGSIFGWYFRAGGQGRKSTETRIEDGVKTILKPAIYVSPYAGTGFRFNMANNLFANGGITAIFTGRPKGSDREYQMTLALGMKI